jgi:hypothetical protein
VLVDEYQDTNHAQYVLVQELVTGGDPRSAYRLLSCASSGTPTSRSTRSGARRSATSWPSSRTTRTPPRSCSSRTTAPPRPSCPRPTRSSPATPAASPRTSGRTPARARRSWATWPTTSTTRPRSWPRRSTGSPTTRVCCRRRWRCSTGPTRSPGCSRRCSSGSACPTRWSAGCASTSGARCATRSPTYGCWPTRPTPCRCAGSSTCPSVASATGRGLHRGARAARGDHLQRRACSGARTPTGWRPLAVGVQGFRT